MAELPDTQPGPIAQRVNSEALLVWLGEQRWFASKSQTLSGLEVVEEAVVDDRLSLAMVQVQFATGAHELYQLLLTPEEADDGEQTIVLGFTTWMGITRITRASFLSIKELEYVEAARALGYGKARIMFRHVLRCGMCAFQFEDKSVTLLPRCPRCGSLNERYRISRL